MSAAVVFETMAALGVSNPAPLAQGGQKLVYTGDLVGVPVVVKIILLSGGMADAIAIERAHREVQLLAAVDSSHVVKVLSEAVEVGDPPLAVAWVEERLTGDDLTALLGPGRLWSEHETVRLLEHLARGLQACHELRVVHRDLSPGNVRRTDSGDFIVMDPGLARHIERTIITGAYQPGTLGHLSPEHLPGRTPTSSSDIFCLGVLAYIALTGTFPIDPVGPDYLARLENSPPPSIQHAVQVSEALAHIVDRCLSHQPARRFLDGSELLDGLRKTGLTS